MVDGNGTGSGTEILVKKWGYTKIAMKQLTSNFDDESLINNVLRSEVYVKLKGRDNSLMLICYMMLSDN